MTDERAEIARAACALDETLAGVTANAADSRNDIPPQDMAGDERERRVIVDLAAHLAAAISLLERGGNAAKKAAPSDKMFDQMLTDYRASLERARAALAAAPQPAPAPAADEREAMIRAMHMTADSCPLDRSLFDTIADALLADGRTRSGDAAGLREALSPEDREWINNRADELFRQSERQRGGVRPATITPMDYRDYFVIDATAERIAALARLSAPETLAWAVVGDGYRKADPLADERVRKATYVDGFRWGQDNMRARAWRIARENMEGARELKDALSRDDVAGRLIYREAEVTALLISEQIRELRIQRTNEKENE